MQPDLAPTKHERAQRLADDLVDLQRRVRDLQRTRPRAAFGSGPPTEQNSRDATTYVDQASGRSYVKGSGGWINSDATRGYAEALGTVSTNIGVWESLGGPSVTLTVPTNGFVLLYADVEVKSGIDGVNPPQAGQVGVYDGGTDFSGGNPVLLIASDTTVNAFQRWASGSIPAFGVTGAHWPDGDFIVFRATAGTRTYSLWYGSGSPPPAPPAVNPNPPASFRNRRLYAAAL